MQQVIQRWWERSAVSIVAATLVAALVALFFFSPRFVYWRALPTSITTAEVARARAAQAQLANPFVRFDDHTNRVSNWRLFFPLLGRALRLPAAVYLALPQVGCLLVLGFAAALLRRHACEWASSLAVLIILATGSWFFVSTGWLGYFDSWFVLGLLVVTFSRPAWCPVLAILVTPWIDERFVLTLPLALMLRLTYLRSFHPRTDGRSEIASVVALGATLLPWLGVRLGAFLLGPDAATRGYLKDFVAYQAAIPASHYLRGLWHGIRWGWVFVVAALYLPPARSVGQRTALVALLLLCVGVNLVVAEDLSRSVATLAPLVLLGALLAAKHHPLVARRAMLAAGCLNLVFPACHVSGKELWPVRYLYAELDRLADPPRTVNPRFYNDQAIIAMNRGNATEAVMLATRAIELDPKQPHTFGNRAVFQYRLGRAAEAMKDITTALELNPREPDFLQTRASLRAERGDLAGAAADLEQALRVASANWPSRPASTEMLAAIRRRLSAP